MSRGAKEFRGGGDYKVTEVPGRRLPWRVHPEGQSASSPLSHAYTTEGGACAALLRLAAPMKSFRVLLLHRD